MNITWSKNRRMKNVGDVRKDRAMKKKITKLENIVLMHACNLRWGTVAARGGGQGGGQLPPGDSGRGRQKRW
jgi:hypothetical protein